MSDPAKRPDSKISDKLQILGRILLSGLFTLVQLANARGKFLEAQAALGKYVELHPHDHNIVYTLAAIKHKLLTFTDAMELVQRRKSLSSSIKSCSARRRMWRSK